MCCDHAVTPLRIKKSVAAYPAIFSGFGGLFKLLGELPIAGDGNSLLSSIQNGLSGVGFKAALDFYPTIHLAYQI
jgi:hypothetical protein